MAPANGALERLFRPSELFPALCAMATGTRVLGADPLVYSPPRACPGSASPMLPTRSGRSRLELPAHLEPSPVWREIRAEIRRVVGESTYEIWLAPLEVESLQEGLLLLRAPAATRAWVAKRFGRLLESTARRVVERDIRVAFTAGDKPAPGGAAPDCEAPLDARGDLNPRYR